MCLQPVPDTPSDTSSHRKLLRNGKLALARCETISIASVVIEDTPTETSELGQGSYTDASEHGRDSDTAAYEHGRHSNASTSEHILNSVTSVSQSNRESDKTITEYDQNVVMNVNEHDRDTVSNVSEQNRDADTDNAEPDRDALSDTPEFHESTVKSNAGPNVETEPDVISSNTSEVTENAVTYRERACRSQVNTIAPLPARCQTMRQNDLYNCLPYVASNGRYQRKHHYTCVIS